MKKETRAEFGLIFITMIWGVGFPLTSLALKGIGPYTLVSIKCFLAAAAILILSAKKLKSIDRKTVIAGFFIALALTAGNLLQTAGMLYTTPSKSSFITGLSVVFVPIILTVMYKKLPGPRIILGVIISVIGLLFLTYNGDKDINLGDILTLACAFVYSFQILLIDKYGKTADGVLLAGVELIFVGLLSLPPAIMMEGYHVETSGIVIAAILITGLLGSGLGMAGQNKLQPYLNPSHAAIIYLCEPVFGVIFSTFIGDILSLRAIFGCILILLAMFIAARE
ncbi:MAG: DMT family transporter [Bacillota bacterium]|nr:DMT family transporter [Bacillota bacterium]